MKSAILAVMLATAPGCSLSAPFECDDSEWNPGLRCDEVLAVARDKLPGDTGIAQLEARQGMHCPEDEPISCPHTPAVVTVYADLLDGRRVFVSVGLEQDGSLSAQPARPVEPGR